MEEKTYHLTKGPIAAIQLGLVLILLYLTTFRNYLLFHTLVELISIIVAFSIFIVIWNSRRFFENNYYLIVGFGFLFVGALDLIHTLTYKGLEIFPSATSNLPTQLWLAARYISSFSFLVAPYFNGKKYKPTPFLLVYSVVFALTLASIFYWKIFPVSYIDGVGLTQFKIISEYVVIAGFLGGLALIYRDRKTYDSRVWKLLILALGTTVVSELMFTLYVGVYDIFNLAGHLLKVAAFYFFYLGIVEVSLMKPYRLLFKNVKDNQVALRESDERNRQLILELDKFQLAVKNASDLIIITDPDGKIIFANNAAVKMTGYQTGEMIGNTPALWGTKMKREFYETLWKTIKFEKSSFHGELVNRRKNGEEFIVDLHISPVVDEQNQVVFFIGIERDITKAKEIDRAKTEFVSLASHQLRTPLTSISLTSELLLRGITGDMDERQRRYLREIHASTKRMAGLINELLNISRIELGTFAVNPEPAALAEHVGKILDELEMQINKRELVLVRNFPENLPIINFDHNVLRMVVENLVTNAIKYTPIGGKITVSLITEDDCIVLKVNDTGYGIPLQEQSKIFTKLFRTDKAREISAEGAGLGLYIAKSVAEKAGSKIWFESMEGGGTTFFLSIPIK